MSLGFESACGSSLDVDDAEVIDRVHVLVRLVRRAQTALILVEDEMLPLAGVFFRKVQRGPELLWICLANDAAHRDRFRRLRAFADRLLAGDDGHIRLYDARVKGEECELESP